MSIELLDKTRKINRLLNRPEKAVVDFKEFCHILSGTLAANVILISSKGKILGVMEREEIPVIPSLQGAFYGKHIDVKIQNRLLDILSTNEHVSLGILGIQASDGYHMMVTPVSMGGERLGSLLVYRMGGEFSLEDVILNEYAATVIGLAMQRAVSEELTEENRKESEVSSAFHTLSKTEKKAIFAVLEEMGEKKEAMLVTSRLSEQAGITRSVLINALKKCAGAGVIETKSAGKKGTYVRIKNELFFKSFQ